MFYIIQTNVFRENHYDRIIKALNRLSLDYEVVSLDGTETFGYVTKRKDVFCFGSLKLARLAKLNRWKPGSLMNKNHDYLIYFKYWKSHMLNSDSLICSLKENIEFRGLEKFIRPTKDSKLFTGKVFSEEEWTDLSNRLLRSKKGEGSMIQIASPKKIYQEIRCWVVDRKVITASTYKIGSQVRYTEYIDSEGLIFAREMISLFQPAEAFVLDICLVEQGWKIVELNCINSAGFYASDLQKLLIELENYYIC